MFREQLEELQSAVFKDSFKTVPSASSNAKIGAPLPN
jgi:hypothetical protein